MNQEQIELWIDEHVWAPLGKAIWDYAGRTIVEGIKARLAWVPEAIDPAVTIFSMSMLLLVMLGSQRAGKYFYWTVSLWTLYNLIKGVL